MNRLKGKEGGEVSVRLGADRRARGDARQHAAMRRNRERERERASAREHGAHTRGDARQRTTDVGCFNPRMSELAADAQSAIAVKRIAIEAIKTMSG